MTDQEEAEAPDADAGAGVDDEPAAGADDRDDEPAEAGEGAENTEEETPAEEGVGEGDFVRLAYTARTVEDGTLVDTTDREVAEEEGVDEEDRTFEPRVVVIGAGHLFDAVEDDIRGAEVGDAGTVTVPAAEAFGEYDEDEVRTVSAEKIPEDERYPGAHVDIDGQHGHLETIIGGRARVDFNHPLAGETVEYDWEVVDVIEDRVERARELLKTYLDVDLEVSIETDEVEEMQPVESEGDEEGEAAADAGDAEAEAAEGEAAADEDEAEESPAEPEFEEVTVEKETLYVESTPQLSFNQQWMFQKQQIAQELIDRTGVDRVVVQEIIDGSGGMMGGMGGMMPGMGGGGGVEEALEEADVEELAEELEDVEE